MGAPTGRVNEPEDGKALNGGTPEVGTPTGPPPPIEEGKDPGGGLEPKGKDWPTGGPNGRTGATFGGNDCCGVPAGLESAPGGGGPGRDIGGEGAVTGNCGD